jgi:hypothetical protein
VGLCYHPFITFDGAAGIGERELQPLGKWFDSIHRLQMTKELDVHDVKPGELGIVAHNKLLSENFMFQHYWDTEKKNRVLQARDHYSISYCNVLLGGDIVEPTKHIPHGDMVLVLSEESPKPIGSNRPVFYKVLWDGNVGWIEKKYVINPWASNAG